MSSTPPGNEPSGDQPVRPADPSRSYGTPPAEPSYGAPQPPSYGAPAQPPSYGAPSYGTPQPPPGAPSGGLPQASYPVPPDPDRRPGTVTAAAWTAIVLSGLSVVLWVVIAVAFSGILELMRENPADFDVTASDLADAEAAQGVVIGFCLVLALVSALTVGLGVLVLKRQNWARITLVVMASITALLGLLSGFAALIPFLWGIAGIAVIVLLFVGGANDWFARRAPQSPGSYPPGGYGGPGYGSPYPQPYGQQGYGPPASQQTPPPQQPPPGSGGWGAPPPSGW